MFSASRRDLDGSRDTHGDDVVGCRRGRPQRNGCESRPPQRRKLGGRATTAYRRRVRLLRLVYTVGVVGAGVVIVWASSSTEAHRAETIETRTTTLRTQARISGERKEMAGVALKKEAAAEGLRASKIGERYVSVAVAGGGGGGDHSSGGLNRLLLATSDEDQQESVEGLADEEEEEGAAAACADNAFSGGGAGTVMLLVIGILFTFNGLAIVCDEFFQASLEKISEVCTSAYFCSHVPVSMNGALCSALPCLAPKGVQRYRAVLVRRKPRVYQQDGALCSLQLETMSGRSWTRTLCCSI